MTTSQGDVEALSIAAPAATIVFVGAKEHLASARPYLPPVWMRRQAVKSTGFGFNAIDIGVLTR